MDIKQLEEYIKGFKGKIKKPLVVFDLETTGLDTAKDQIIQFAGVKIFPKGDMEEFTFKCKPTCPIHPKATESHGYKDEDLKDFKEFKNFANLVSDFFKDAEVVAGFNIARFDVKMLSRQMEEAGFKDIFEGKVVYDSYPVYLTHSGRKLSDAFKFYTSKDIENAHDALGDVRSTIAVMAQQAAFEKSDFKAIAEKAAASSPKDSILEKYITTKDKKHILNFGKHKGKSLDQVDKGFIKWVMNKDFPKEVKAVMKKYL